MRQSNLAIAVRREFSSNAVTASHKWLERGGFILQHAAGINHYGHLFTKTLKKVEALIDRHLEAAGAAQVQLSQLQSASLWKESGRWDIYNDAENSGAMYTTESRNGQLFTLAASAEEAAVEFIKANVISTGKLSEEGVSIYQHGNKLRDEIRAAGGVIRGKEFRMMDAYSFSATEAGMEKAYQSIRTALVNMLEDLGLEYALVAADNGDMGGSVSEELMVFSEIGNDIIWIDETGQAANEEVADTIEWIGEVKKRRAIEVGHIFQLGTRYSEKMGLMWDSNNGREAVHMGCYGIGTSRLIAAYVEQNHDENGMIWGDNISAYDVHIIQLGNDSSVSDAVESLSSSLTKARIDVLIDDRKGISAGAKFAEADIIGQSKQIIIGKRSVSQGQVEIKDRRTGERETINIDDVVQKLLGL
jgi:prolyl-tRNA synthetase